MTSGKREVGIDKTPFQEIELVSSWFMVEATTCCIYVSTEDTTAHPQQSDQHHLVTAERFKSQKQRQEGYPHPACMTENHANTSCLRNHNKSRPS